MDETFKTGDPIGIAQDADISSSSKPTKRDWMGSMAGTCQILGDIVGPSTDEDEWDALR